MTLFLQSVFFLSVLGIIWPYTFYPMILWVVSRGARHSRSPSVSDERLPTVSVVVAAYNEERHITQRMENLLALDYPREKLELLMVSDGSSDATNDLVKAFAGRGIQLYEIRNRGGKVNALNQAVPVTRGEIVVFSDANTDFAPEALRHLVAPFEDASVGAVCGKLVFKVPGASSSGEMENAYWDLETAIKTMEGSIGCVLGANGGNYAVRRSCWTQSPPETLIEDFVVPMRVLQQGHKVTFAQQAVAYEDSALRVQDEFTRRVRIGAGGFQALAMLLPMLSPSRGFAAVAFLSRKVLRWMTPLFLVLALVASGLLVGNPVYRWLFGLQVVGYGVSMLSLTARDTTTPRLLKLGGYFLLMNAALACGFFSWLTGRQSVCWKRTPRCSTEKP